MTIRQLQMCLTLVPFALMAFATVGCGGSTTVTPGGTVTENPDGTVTLKQPGATTEFSKGAGGVSLPDDFDKDVPVYPDAKIVLVNKSGAMTMVATETGDSIQQVYDFYEKELAANEWENNQTLKTDKGGNISSKKDKRICTITVAAKTTGPTVVTIMLQSVP